MDAATQEPALQARAIMRERDRAALATVVADAKAKNGNRGPYASLVLVTLDHDATPLLLLSDLADHSRNIAADPRVSLLFDGTLEWEEPLAGPRVSIIGRAVRRTDQALLERFIRRHPSAELYAGFQDFHVYAVELERAHVVAGFGAINWIEAEDLRIAETAWLVQAESAIVDHMNDDHPEALELIAVRLLGQRAGAWRMTGLDPDGADLRLGSDTARIAFEQCVGNVEACRTELVRLTARARSAAAEASADR
jgi:putative heme iron utilization protein